MEVNHYRRPARGRSKETDESAGDGGDFHGHLLVAYGLSGALVDSTGSHSRCNYVVTKLEIELQMIDSQRVGTRPLLIPQGLARLLRISTFRGVSKSIGTVRRVNESPSVSGYCFTRSSQQSRIACSKSRTEGTQCRLPSACISILRSSI